MDRIRDAGKWLIGASAAVGAVLIAGSQLSSIGQLAFGWRLGVAIGGVMLALAAVVFAVWAAVQVLLPVGVTLDELKKNWSANKRADVVFFHENPGQLGADSPEQLDQRWTRAWEVRVRRERELQSASSDADRATKKASFDESDAEFRRVNGEVGTILQNAQYQLLQHRFGNILKQLLGAAALAAVGIMLFAWAANPPKAPAVATTLRDARLTGADLRDANLVGVDLTGTDLTGTNLRGADMRSAVITHVTWSHTTCPDGTSSDDDGGSCKGHLKP
jgi:hypothetical protein